MNISLHKSMSIQQFSIFFFNFFDFLLCTIKNDRKNVFFLYVSGQSLVMLRVPPTLRLLHSLGQIRFRTYPMGLAFLQFSIALFLRVIPILMACSTSVISTRDRPFLRIRKILCTVFRRCNQAVYHQIHLSTLLHFDA